MISVSFHFKDAGIALVAEHPSAATQWVQALGLEADTITAAPAEDGNSGPRPSTDSPIAEFVGEHADTANQWQQVLSES